jgi:hypothetical protein
MKRMECRMHSRDTCTMVGSQSYGSREIYELEWEVPVLKPRSSNFFIFVVYLQLDILTALLYELRECDPRSTGANVDDSYLARAIIRLFIDSVSASVLDHPT